MSVCCCLLEGQDKMCVRLCESERVSLCDRDRERERERMCVRVSWCVAE